MEEGALRHDQLLEACDDADVLWRRSNVIYALYRLHNCLRHGGVARRDAEGAFTEYYREAMRTDGGTAD